MNLGLISAETALSVARQSARACHVNIPGELDDELARLDAALQSAAPLAADRARVAGLVLDAWLAGRDPLDDEQARRAATGTALASSGIPGAVGAEAERRKAVLITRHAPAIMAAFEPTIQQADQTLLEARSATPGIDFRNPATITLVPTEHTGLWGRAREALNQVRAVAQAWGMLATACRLTTMGTPGAHALIVAELSMEQVDGLGQDATPEAVAAAGHRLSLASPGAHAERVNALNAERLAAQSDTPPTPTTPRPASHGTLSA